MNSCDDYERIRKRIEEERKKYQICYVQGPTGPREKKEIEEFQDLQVLMLELQKR